MFQLHHPSISFLLTQVWIVNIVFCTNCKRSDEFNRIGDLLHPKTSGGFLKTTTAPRVDCASQCETSRIPDCFSFYHNPTDNQCFLVSAGQVVVADSTFPDITDNRFDLYGMKSKYAADNTHVVA